MVDLLFLNPCWAELKNLVFFKSSSICFLATLSQILTMFEHKLMGLTLLGLFALDFLGIGTTTILLRHSGMTPDLNDILPITVMCLVIMFLVLTMNSLQSSILIK